MKPKVYIRADGSQIIGLGHLVRCSALAYMLKEDFEITFYCKEVPDTVIAELDDSGFSCCKIENEDEFLSQLNGNTIAVLDGYAFDTGYQKQVKATGSKLVCIDDLHDKEFFADLIINHAPGITPQDYKTQPYTQFALGFEYALLRPAFLEQAKKQRTIDKIEAVMICYGGSDPKNLTQSTLQVAMKFPQFKKIIVVIGSTYQTTASFNRLIASDSRIDRRHALNEQQMLDTMLEAELVIVPASGILFEVLAAGCIAISGSYIDNQKFVYENFRNAGIFVDAGNFLYKNLYDAVSKVLDGSINQVRFIDGQTAIKVSKLFDQLQKEFLINLRRASTADLDLTFGWAANPEIRRFSFHQHQIIKPEHTNWFLKKTIDSNCYYFIVEYNRVPIGSIRFDIEEGEAMISYLLDPSYHGRGFGQLILKKGIEWLMIVNMPELAPIRVISGEVMKTNIPSIKVFERLGFVKKEQMENYKFEKWV